MSESFPEKVAGPRRGQRSWDELEERRAVFPTNYPSEEFSPPAEWHIAALRDAGFAEAGVVWRSGTGAVVAAVR